MQKRRKRGKRFKKKWLSVVVALSFVCFQISCYVPYTEGSEAYEYQIPKQLDDGWNVSSLSEVKMNEEIITKLTREIVQGKFKGINSMLIVKDGALVHEAYFGDHHQENLHKLYSITKSLSSTLIGITIEKGFIRSLDEPIHTFFPQFNDAFQDPAKRKITLRHILTLTSGFEWDEKTYSCCDLRNSECQLLRSNDWMKFIVERPVKDDPGTKWVYNTGSVHLLSSIIKKATGKSADAFAEENLLKPLGISRYEWKEDPQKYPSTGGIYGGICLTTRDAAKFGYLFLNGGKWKDDQIVSEEWVRDATQAHVTPSPNRSFGYLWWKGQFLLKGRKIGHFYAAGYGGQSIHIVPELNLMIVFTCWSQKKDADIFGPTLMIYKAALGD